MSLRLTDPEYRPISIIGGIQLVVVLAGVFLTSAMLKAHGYGSDTQPLWHYRAAAVWVRHYGGVLLLIPALWVILAVRSTRPEAARWQQPFQLALGIGLVLFGIYWFLRTALEPTVPKFWMHEG